MEHLSYISAANNRIPAMRHFPVFVDLAGRRVVLAGGGDAALAKLRILMKTEARITVFAADAAPEIAAWAAQGHLTWIARAFGPGDALCAALAYAATDDAAEDARVAALMRADGARVNMVDNLDGSDFITPAIVDRDPVVVAIGTEGAAPVLARAVKTHLEDHLSPTLGMLARIGKAFRGAVEALPHGRARRDFWAEYYASAGPAALERGGEAEVERALRVMLARYLVEEAAPAISRKGRVEFVGAGPGDPDLLTLKARKALDVADVVIFDRLVAPAILELARREATLIDAGKEGFGPSTPQADIDAMIVDHARSGAHVVRLKSGDPTVFGRLDEEIAAVEAAGIDWAIVPGITAASAAVAAIGQSLTRRGRNAGVRLITGHDMAGFADHDWRALARPGEVAAVYMGKRATRYIQGRMLMHGADPALPVSVVENASRPDQRVLATTLGQMAQALAEAEMGGPALMVLGLAPRAAAVAAAEFKQEIAL
jgi:uroporphyrin-III C-methyltransferase / precorrin-2 dehydrogenase / sirohydrochlorin ferrochelatase